MEIYCISSEEIKDELEGLGALCITYGEEDKIGKEDTVVINDKDNTCPQDVVNKLLDKGIKVIYLFDEPNSAMLRLLVRRNSYNIYRKSERVDIDFLIAILETNLALEDIEHLIDKDIEVNSISELVEVVELFFEAMDSKNKEIMEEVYTEYFDQMLKLPEMFKEVINESHVTERELRKLKNVIEGKDKIITNLNTRLDTLITAGRKTEENNTKLMKAVENLKKIIEDKEEAIKSTNEEVYEQSRKIQSLEKDKSDLGIQLDEATENRNFLKNRYDRSIRELDELTQTVKGVNMSIENVEVNLTSTGSVEKILYIKAVDMVPYIVSSLVLYPKYAESKLKLKGCSILIIAPKSSTLYKEHASKHIVFNPKEESYEKGIYVMDGYNEKIEHWVMKINSQVVIVVDLTMREGTLTNSVRQTNMYVVNSMDSIEMHRLNPTSCIGFNDLKEHGVTAHIPNNVHDKSNGVRIKEVRESLFVVLDRIWR